MSYANKDASSPLESETASLGGPQVLFPEQRELVEDEHGERRAWGGSRNAMEV